MGNKNWALGAGIVGLVCALAEPALALGALSGPAVTPIRGRPTWSSGHPALCSDPLDLCVHAPNTRAASELAATLHALQGAVVVLRDVLRWPAPLPDGALGGNRAFDVYLERNDGSNSFYEVIGDVPVDIDEVDRSSAFARVSPNLPASCLRSAVLAEAWARAGLFGIDAGENHALAMATSSYVASVAIDCELAWIDAIDDYQANPQLAASQDSVAGGRGAMLLPWFIQTHLGAHENVDLIHALWRVSAQRTPPGNMRYVNRPDWLDVLRSLQKDRNATLGDLLLEYSIARAFIGDRDDGIHMTDSTWLGRAGRVRFDASIDYRSLPQWIRPVASIEPTGATYLWLDVSNAPPGAGLGFRAQWEAPAMFRFAFLRVGADGTEIGRVEPVTPEKATELEFNLELLDRTAAVMIVGANVGAPKGEFRFDPDEMPYDAQNYLITLVAQR